MKWISAQHEWQLFAVVVFTLVSDCTGTMTHNNICMKNKAMVEYHLLYYIVLVFKCVSEITV